MRSVVVGFVRRVFDRAVQALGLAIRPRMVGSGEFVPDAEGAADSVEGVPTQQRGGRPVAIAGLVSEGGAIIRGDGVDPVGEGTDCALGGTSLQ